MEDWTNTFGYQSLFHMKGGNTEAQTCVLGPMSVEKYRLLLRLIKPGSSHADAPPCSPDMWENGKGAVNWKVTKTTTSGWELLRELANRVFGTLNNADSVLTLPQNDLKWLMTLNE